MERIFFHESKLSSQAISTSRAPGRTSRDSHKGLFRIITFARSGVSAQVSAVWQVAKRVTVFRCDVYSSAALIGRSRIAASNDPGQDVLGSGQDWRRFLLSVKSSFVSCA